MKKSEYSEIGVIVKPHGLKGDLVIKVDAGIETLFADFKAVFVEMGGAYIPHVIESHAPLNKGKVKAKFAGIQSAVEAELMRGKAVFQLSSQLNLDRQLNLEGFIIMDQHKGEIGEILAVIDSTAQTLLEVEYKGEEIYVPLVDQFVVEVDTKNKILKMDLPEGILDL
jgi:16S rRNA processing protein RimM